MIVICPMCRKQMEISAEQKNIRIECASCKESFMAYEAVICEQCGDLKHPNHICGCWGDQIKTDELLDEIELENPFCWKKLQKAAAEIQDPMRISAMNLAAMQAMADKQKKEKEMAELFSTLPADLRTVLEYESGKYERLFRFMKEKIEELEETIFDLEDEIEALKEKVN